MQPGERKKLIILAVLIGVIAAIWGYRLVSGNADKSPADDARLKKGGWALPPTKPIKVNLGLLDREKPEYSVGRNIFDPTYSKPDIKPPTPDKQSAKPKGPPPPPPKDTDGDGVPDGLDRCPDTPPGTQVDGTGCRPKTREELMREKAAKEMEEFKFIGFLKRSDRMDVFLTLGKEYFVAVAGQEITKGYFLKEIGPNFLLFEHPESGATVRIDVDFSEGASASTVPSPGSGGGGPRPAPAPSGGSPRPQISRPPDARPSLRPATGVAAGLPPSAGSAEDYDEEEDEEEDEDYYQDDTEPEPGEADAPGGLTSGSVW